MLLSQLYCGHPNKTWHLDEDIFDLGVFKKKYACIF